MTGWLGIGVDGDDLEVARVAGAQHEVVRPHLLMTSAGLRDDAECLLDETGAGREVWGHHHEVVDDGGHRSAATTVVAARGRGTA